MPELGETTARAALLAVFLLPALGAALARLPVGRVAAAAPPLVAAVAWGASLYLAAEVRGKTFEWLLGGWGWRIDALAAGALVVSLGAALALQLYTFALGSRRGSGGGAAAVALLSAGAALVMTADHGMNDKHLASGEPDVIYLQTQIDTWLGGGRSRVILPITDPYVVHHGALGGYATIYLNEPALGDDIIRQLSDLSGVEWAGSREEACQRFELPPDRVGDVVVVAEAGKVLGTAAEEHDLSGLQEPLRSHGSLAEQRVPFCLNRPVTGLDPDHNLRNFDIFDIALNHVSG